jgi:integrase
MKKKQKHNACSSGHTEDRGQSWRHKYRGEFCIFHKADGTERDAERKFLAFRDEVDKQKALGVTPQENTVAYAMRLWKANQIEQGNAQVDNAWGMIRKHVLNEKTGIGHLSAYDPKIVQLVRAYRSKRLETPGKAGRTPRHATLNKEIQHIAQALALLVPPVALPIKPLKLEDDAIRQNEIDDDTYRRLMQVVPDWYKPLWCIARASGLRQGALRKVMRDHAEDFAERRAIWVPAVDRYGRIQKNGEGGWLDLSTPEMFEYVRWAWENGDPKCPFLFQRDGKQIKKDGCRHFREKACEELGLGKVLFHDTRRSAATNCLRAGMTREEGQHFLNMKTPSIFGRYDKTKKFEKLARQKVSGEKLRKFLEQSREENLPTNLPTDPTENFSKAVKPN